MAVHHNSPRKKMYVPWFPSEDNDPSFLSYIHHSLHHEIGEDVGFEDSSWSYTKDESSFERKHHSDLDIYNEVVDALYKDPKVDASKIQILVHNGSVNLSGTVRTIEEKNYADRLVRFLDHVWNVENEIRIDEEGPKRRFYDLPASS